MRNTVYEMKSMAAGWMLVGLALWLAGHPYLGIWHDAKVYTLMAVNWLDHAPYARDLWFQFGSQDSISLFSPIYGTAIRALGVEYGAMGIAALGGLLFVIAAFRLSQELGFGRGNLLVFLLLVSIHLPYSPNSPGGFLQVTESFVTARAFAVPLSLLGLALEWSGKPRIAWGCYLLAFVLHPLMAIWIPAISIAVRLRDVLLLRLLVAGGAIAVTASLLGWPPIQPMEATWAEGVRRISLIVFVPGSGHDAEPTIFALSILLLGAAYAGQRWRRWYLMAALVGAIGYLVSVLCSLFFPAVLIMQAQPWRALWPAMVLSVVAACDLALVCWSGGWRTRAVLALCTAAATLLGLGGGYLLFGGYLALNAAKPRISGWIDSYRKWIQPGSTLLAFVAVFMFSLGAVVDFEMAAIGVPAGRASGRWTQLAYGVLLTGGFGIQPIAIWVCCGRLRPLAVALAAVPLVAWAAANWDGRPWYLHHLEAHFTGNRNGEMFDGKIAPGATVYWPQSPERVWFELGTANYASPAQATGVVFSQARYRELDSRLARITRSGQADLSISPADVADGQRRVAEFRPATSLNATKRPEWLENENLSRPGLQFLCEDRNLDFVVQHLIFSDLAVAIYNDRGEMGREFTYALYDCGLIRHAVP